MPLDVFDAAVALQAGDLLAARGLLARQVAAANAAPLPAWLMQSDVQLMEGEGAAAAMKSLPVNAVGAHANVQGSRKSQP